ncbi:MAG: DUF11 domain-containing protein [Anaerolineae bacterium]|nr:DUF11 domain-containing protein [Anaerolineae bacterium]
MNTKTVAWKFLSLVLLTLLLFLVPAARAATTVYNFVGVTPATCSSNGICAHESDVDTFPYGSAFDQNDFTEPNSTEYGNIADPGTNDWVTDDPDFGDEIFVQFDMRINEAVTSIIQIDLTFTGYTEGGNSQHRIYVLRAGANPFVASSWQQVGSSQNFSSLTEMTRSITSDFEDYVNSNGRITWGVYTTNDSENMHVSYVEMVVTTNGVPNAPTNPRTEGQTNPPNVSDTAPEFSWTFSDPDLPGDAQSAYQIQVGTDTNWGNGAELWDTGKVTGAPGAATNVEYAGTTLTLNGLTYYWRVCTWDSHDAAGPCTATQQFTMIVNQAPTTPVNSIPANASFTTAQNPSFTWSAYNDPDGNPQALIRVQLRPNGGSYGGAGSQDSDEVANITSTYTPSGWNLGTGTYYWRVQVRDSIGSWSNFSTETFFTVDRIPPTSTASSPPFDNAGTIAVGWTASDNVGGSGVASVVLWYRFNGGAWANSGLAPQSGGSGTFVFSPPSGDGTYDFQAVATDTLGNSETLGGVEDTTVYDTSGPTSQATPPAGPVNTPPIAVPWTANGAVSGIAANGVQLWVRTPGSGSFANTGLTASGGSGTFNYTPAAGDGTYCFYTIAADNAGNVEAAPGGANGDGCTLYRNQATIGDFVWRDDDGDAIQEATDGNGQQDAGEPGLSGVTLALSQGGSTLGTTTTNASGFYTFTNLAAGTYTVTVTGGVPAGLTPTSAQPSPRVVTVSAGQDFDVANFGYGPFAVIGDLIFTDADRDGAFDTGETGLANITVWLYSDGNGNGRIDGSDSIVKTTSTNTAGVYAFRGVAPGNYTVLADANDPNLPTSFRPTGLNPVAVANVVVGNTYGNADIGFNTPPPVTKQLYLRTTNVLSRTQPTGATHTTRQIVNNNSFVWQQTPALAGPVTVIDNQPILAQIRIDAFPSTGLICGGQNPDVQATLRIAGGGNLDTDTINNMTPGLNIRTFTFNVNPGTVIPAGARLELQLSVSGADCGVGSGYIIVNFDSVSELSRLEIPTSSYIKIDQAGTFDAAYPGGAATPIFIQGDTVYVRATASDPFGGFDISGATLTVPGVVTNQAMTLVNTGSLTRTFQATLPGLLGGNYTYVITATEGVEGQVTDTASGAFSVIVSNLGNSTKTVDKATAVPGDVLTYTIVLSNTGGLNATVRMTDTLPANVTHLNGPTGGGTWSPGNNAVLFTGLVPANGQVVITHSVRANAVLDHGTIIANNVTIDDGFSKFDTSPPATTVIQSAPNLIQSAKSVNVSTAAPGDFLDYTIVLTNSGNMNAVIDPGSPVLDNIPANASFNGGLFASAGQISYNTGFDRVEWYGTVPAGGSVTLRYRVRLGTPLDRGTVITNTALINEGTGFPAPQTYTRTITSTIISSPILTSTSAKLVDKAIAAPGDSLVYSILLRNSGNMNAPGVVLTDTLPAQVTWGGNGFMSATSGIVQFFPITNTLVWNGDLNAGATVQILFRANVNSPLPNNTQITNVARVFDGAGNFTPFTLSALTVVQSAPNLNTSTKTVVPTTASPGDVLTYTIRLVNSGNAVANTSVVDTLPVQLQNPVIISVSGGQAQVVGGNSITWTGQVTPAQPVTITFRATLRPVLDNGTQVANTAQVNDGVNPAFFIAPAAVTTIQSAPDLNTSLKTVDRATASPNDLLIYTITLTNTGDMVADALVRDILPPNVTFNGGLSASPGAPLPTYSSINNRVSWQGDVTPGTPITVSYRVRINTPLDDDTVILNDAEINDGAGGLFDTNPPAQTIIDSAPNLTTSSKAVDLTTASPGELLHYTVRLVNNGNMVATGVSISDTIPAEVTFASGPFVTGGGSASYVGPQRRVTWNGSVAPGNDIIVEYYATVNSPLVSGTPIVNDAQIQGNFGTIATNQVTTTVASDHQLTLAKNAPSAVGAGQAMTYTIQYNVTGNEPAPSVVITDTVPTNTTYGGCGGASCVQNGGVVTWTLNNLNPSSAGSVTLRVNVAGVLPNGTAITNTAYIFDADDGAAQAEATTTVTSGHGFSLTKRDTGFDPVQAGNPITYNIDWSVGGAEVAQSVIITDRVPLSTTYASCGGATCVQGGGIVTWTLNNQSPGASGTVNMTVNVPSPQPNGTIITNQARIFDSNGGVATTDTEQTTVNSSHTLDVEKTAPVSAPAGGQITYSITYAVTGNEAAQNLVIEDVTPPNTTFASAGGVGATIENPGAGNTGTVRWRLGTRNPGATGVVTMTVNVASPLPRGTLINNTATIQDSNGGATDVDSASTSVTSGHAFTLTKSDTPDPSLPNGIINYTLHWVVTGNEPAQNVTITDTIPANTTFFGCSGCSQQGGVVQWNLGNRIPGENGDVTLQVQVNSPLPNGTVISNQAHIFDGNSGTPAAASTTTTVQSGHNLTLSKSAPSIVQAGQVINYTLNWSVTGNEGAPDVVVTDTIPANTTYVAGSCTAGCTVAGGVVTWDLGDLVPGNAGSLNLAVTTSAVLTNGTRITNTARISDTDGGAALASAVTTISSGHGFSLTKRDTGFDPVQAGTQLTYSIDWAVAGTEQAQNVVISDTLPANTTFANCAPAPCSLGAGNVVTWNLGNRNPNTSGTVSLTVNVAGALANGTLLTNQARIGDSNGGIAATSNIEQTTVSSSHSLSVNKNAPANAAAGGQIVYTMTWTVSGNEPAQNVVIEDNTPVNTTFASAAGATTINNPGVGNSGLVRWNLPSPLNPGATGVVTLTVNVLSPLPNGTSINNTASIRDSNNGTTDQDTAATSVGSGHTLTLTNTDTPDPVSPGNFINYTIHWTVTGNEPAQNVVITDTIPANTTFFGCSGCSQQGSTVQWNLGTRNPGESGDVTLQVQVNSPLPNNTVIPNTARISDGNGGTPVTASTTTTVQSSNQLTLSKSAPSIVQAGQTINYTINWSVTGNQAAPGVIITDAVPISTTYASCSGATCSLGAGNVVTWDLGNLVPGNSGTVNLVVTAGNLLPNGTVITNTARIRDNNGASAQSSASTTVSSGHGFSLTKSDSVDPVQAGAQLIYTIGWSVIGTEQAQNVVISDTLPANTTFANCAPAPCSLGAGNVVTWNLGNRNPNTSGTVSLTVNVAGALANGTLLTNQARIGDSNGGIAATSNIEQTTVSSSHSLSVNKNAPANAAAGGQIVYTMTWTVSGNEPAQNVVIEDNTPVNTTFASAAGATTINNPGVGNSGLVRWNLPSPLNPGATGVVTLTVNVLSPLPNGTSINNTASIRDSNNGSTGQDTTTTTVGSGHGFTLTKIDTPDPVSPNNLINYTIHWEVTGNETAQNVVITDTIPANTTFFSCGGCSQQGGGTFVQWNLGNRGPGESGDVTLQVRVNPLTPNGTVIPNTARIFDNNNGTRATASTTTTVQSSHTLTIDKRAPVAVAAGQQIVYTIDYNVVGDELAPTVVITDPIPAGTTYVANSCTGGCVVAGGIVTWNLGNLLPGIPGQVQFAVRVDNNVPNGTEITNIAYIRDNSGANATDSTITRIGTDLLIDLADNRETVQPGERITYTASFSGTEPLNFGSVEIDLPANTTFISASGGFLQSGNTIFWLVTSQPAGFFGQRYIVVQLPPVMDNGTVVSTTARIAGDGKSNREDESAVVVSRPDLSTSVKTVSNPGAAPGELVTYQIVLSNTGNMHAYNSTITDVIPAGLTYTGTVTASSGTLTSVGGPIGWQGEVRVGTPVTISFKAQVGSAVAAGTIIQNVVDINDGFNPGLIQKVAIIAVGSQAPAVQAIYLPFITRGSGGGSTPPTGPDVELTIRNCGDVNAVGAFWVDLYFNPNEQSVFWPIGHGEGYDWFGQGAGFVVSTLGPGQSVSLHLADAVVKNIPNPLPSSARLYAQVDLFDNATPGIGVVDEGPNGEANNVAGSNGRTCSATAGKPDLIVESIKLVGTSSAAAASTTEAAQVEGVAVAPARIQPPQH